MKRNIGVYVITALVASNLFLWVLLPPANFDPQAYPKPSLQQFAEMLSSSAMILWACGIFLSNKPRALEPYFGGLDRMYIIHKNINILALLIIVVHLIIVPTSATGGPGVWIAWVTFPSILIMVLLTVSPRLPLIGELARLSYDRWHNLHRYMGVLFIMGATHMLMAEPIIMHTPVVFGYVETLIAGGVLSYLYRQFLWERLKRREPFLVQDVRKLNGTVAQVTLRPQVKPLRHRAGQFLYVHFDADRILREPHPFTISSSPQEQDVRLSIKSSGDWTQHLHEHLQQGARAFVDGPYGEFNYKTGSSQQIWIAAGIGLTPFLSWIRDFRGAAPERDVDFFYTTTVPEEAIFVDEIDEAGKQPGFRTHVLHTARDGRLSADKVVKVSSGVEGKDIYICGPIRMVEAFRDGFMRHGVPRSRIHYEEFNFR